MKLTEEQEVVCESVILWINKCFNFLPENLSNGTFLTIGWIRGDWKDNSYCRVKETN